MSEETPKYAGQAPRTLTVTWRQWNQTLDQLGAAMEWIRNTTLYHSPNCVLAGHGASIDGPQPDYACTCSVGPALIRRRELLGGGTDAPT